MTQLVRSHYQNAILETARAGQSMAIKGVPGCSKTRVLIWTANQEKEHGRDFKFVAFSNAIVDELKRELNQDAATTCHKLGFGAVKRYFSSVNFGGATKDKYVDFFKVNYNFKRAFNGNNKKWFSATFRMAKIVDLVQATMCDYTDPDALDAMFDVMGIIPPLTLEETAGWIYQAMVFGRDALNTGQCSFGDMIYYPATMDELTLPEMDAVGYDECQDASSMVIKLLAKVPTQQFIAVGDPFQAIYGFAGASSGAFGEVAALAHNNYMPLSISYRCHDDHLQLARHINPDMEAWENHPGGTITHLDYKECFDVIALGDLVIARTNQVLINAALKLIKMGKPAHVVGKDIATQIQNAIESVGKRHGFMWGSFSHFLMAWHQAGRDEILNTCGMANPSKRLNHLADIVECVRIIKEESGADSLNELTQAVQTIFAESQRSIRLMSGHRSKGLENERVVVLGYDQLPYTSIKMSEDQVQQENNLFLVMMTRSKRDLILVSGVPRTSPRRQADESEGE